MAEKPLVSARDTIRDRISVATKLLRGCVHNSQVKGIQRLSRKLKAEVEFLESLLEDVANIKEQHLASTNLQNLEAIQFIFDCAQNVTAVLQSFLYLLPSGEGRSVMVDVVTNKGSHWVKVITRKRTAIHRRWLGESQYEDKCITETAEDFMKASSQNPHQGNNHPKIVFVFFDGVTKDVAVALQKVGVTVVGQQFSADSLDQSDTPLEIVQVLRGIPTATDHMRQAVQQVLHVATPTSNMIYLDISSMIAWVSGLTHGGERFHYQDGIIEEQAELQRRQPLWPVFQGVTGGMKLCACSTAVTDFKKIVSVVGGAGEQQRAEELLAQVTVLPDNPSSRFAQLPTTSRIKRRTKVIFGTADMLNIPILTANEGFVRSVNQQGITCDVTLHHPCALSEKKLTS